MEQTTKAVRTTNLQGNQLTLDGPELKAGDAAPDFDVVDASLQPVNLEKTGKSVRIFSVVPSLDTPVCDAQTKRFEDEVTKLDGVKVFTISMDLPFAQKRWCGDFGIHNVTMLSDHKSGSFGEHYGTLIKDLRIESRAVFVVDEGNKVRYAEYVSEVGNPPNFDAVLDSVRSVSKDGSTKETTATGA